MNRQDYVRKVYSLIDVFADVGGLYGAISPICVIVLLITNFWSSYQFLAGDLFVSGGSKDSPKSSKHTFHKTTNNLKRSEDKNNV